MCDDMDYDTARLRREGHQEELNSIAEDLNNAIDEYNDIVESRINHEGYYTASDERRALHEVNRLKKRYDEEDFYLP